MKKTGMASEQYQYYFQKIQSHMTIDRISVKDIIIEVLTGLFVIGSVIFVLSIAMIGF